MNPLNGLRHLDRRTLVTSGLFATCVLIFQFVPLYNSLGYEYSTAVASLLTIFGVSRGVRIVEGQSVWHSALAESRVMLAWVAFAVVVSMLNALRVPLCEPAPGLVYVLVLSVGAIPSVLATTATARRTPWPARMGALIVFVSVAWSAAYLATQPDITAYNPFFGYFAGSIYDESLVGTATHFVYRSFTISVAALVLCIIEYRERPRSLELRWAVALAVVVSVFAMNLGQLGISKSRGFVVDELGGFVATEHFDIYFDASAFDEPSVEQLVWDHEARYAELAEFWQVEPTHRLHSFVYGNRNEKGRLMGGYRTLVAKIWLGEMHITWTGIGDDLLAHEMAHLFLRDAGSGPLDLSSRWGLIPNMALVEGAASASEWGSPEWDGHYWSAAMRAEGIAESIPELLGPVGFWSRYSRRAYTLTGSFARWLINERGPAPFLEAYRYGDFEGAYGESLESLAAGWGAWLDELEVGPALQRSATWRYDRPSLFGRRCARSIATRIEEGDRFRLSGQREDAARCYESVIADDPNNGRQRIAIARRYIRLEDAGRALELVQWVLDREEAGLALQAEARELRADMYWRAGDATTAASMYATLAEEAGTEGDVRRFQAKTQGASLVGRAPATSAAIRRALVDVPSAPQGVVTTELYAAYELEGVAIAGYLAVIRLVGRHESPLVEPLVASLRARRGELSDAQGRWLSGVHARHLTLVGSEDACATAWPHVSESAIQGTELAAQAEMWLGRCARGDMPAP
ncbi:MAG: tetratricopeptide (TPR) repeat protein [Bradymonadia bacterium]